MRSLRALAIGTVLLWSPLAAAQLTDNSQNTPNVPGGSVAKSLSQQIGAGHGNENVARSAMYLIKRDPARSIRRGRQLFQRKFTMEQGFGPRVSHNSVGNIANTAAFGAGLVDSCAGCHGRPRGSAGFGGDVVTRPDSRDAPHLFGLGLVEQLADEITRDLREQRDRAVSEARRQRRSVTVELESKNIEFGRLTASSNGSVNTSSVRGVDPDLRVKPLFHHGGTISIREFLMGAFKDEMGLESVDPVLCAVTSPSNPTRQVSPSGFVFDPALDTFARPPA
ncbi:MAG: di-heme oxidoredictase family protein, partial [Candidatus Rokuibacteriota bacterium]